jgi:hypothetical protein
MNLKELEELKNFNELDMLLKLIKKAEGIKKRTEDLILDVKAARVDVRKTMNDIKLLSDIIRDEIQRRTNQNIPIEESKLFKSIEAEKKRLEKEEIRIRKIEAKRAERHNG